VFTTVDLQGVTAGDWGRFTQPLTPAAVGFVDTPVKEAPATWGRRRTVLRILSAGLAHPKPGAEELDYRNNQTVIRNTRWPRSVRIVVGNDKGGVGKTPAALILGGIIAEQGRTVAVWDAADARGTLTERAEGAPGRCVSFVEADPGDYRLPGTMGAVTTKQSSFADVLGSLTAREFDADSVERVTWSLDRTHQVQVADTGNVPHSEAFEKVIALADVLVVPTLVTADSVTKATRLLQRLQDRAGSYPLTAGAVVAVMRYGGPETPGLLAQLPGIFKGVGVGAVIDIPFDPVIARGTTINTRDLTRASRLAWTRLATATVNNITITEGN
jgi:MinD-like ATPase involved in chromosome partitioning or flagellar assembly